MADTKTIAMRSPNGVLLKTEHTYLDSDVFVAPSLMAEKITPTEEVQTLEPAEGFVGYSEVVVNAIPEEYKNVSDATAQAADIRYAKTAYAAEGQLVGTIKDYDGASHGGLQGSRGIVYVDDLPEEGIPNTIYRKVKRNFCNLGYYFDAEQLLADYPDIMGEEGINVMESLPVKGFINDLANIGRLYGTAMGEDDKELADLDGGGIISWLISRLQFVGVDTLPEKPPIKSDDVFDGLFHFTIYYEYSTGKLYSYISSIFRAFFLEEELPGRWIDFQALIDSFLEDAAADDSEVDWEYIENIRNALFRVQGAAITQADCKKTGIYAIEKESVDYVYSDKDEFLPDILVCGVNIVYILVILILALGDFDDSPFELPIELNEIVKFHVYQVDELPEAGEEWVAYDFIDDTEEVFSQIHINFYYEIPTKRLYVFSSNENIENEDKWIWISCDTVSWVDESGELIDDPWATVDVIADTSLSIIEHYRESGFHELLLGIDLLDFIPIQLVHRTPGFYKLYSDVDEIAAPAFGYSYTAPASIISQVPMYISEAYSLMDTGTKPSGTITITSNGNHSVKNYEYANVKVDTKPRHRLTLNYHNTSVNSTICFKRGEANV